MLFVEVLHVKNVFKLHHVRSDCSVRILHGGDQRLHRPRLELVEMLGDVAEHLVDRLVSVSGT